jgi:hypothetical protein
MSSSPNQPNECDVVVCAALEHSKQFVNSETLRNEFRLDFVCCGHGSTRDRTYFCQYLAKFHTRSWQCRADILPLGFLTAPADSGLVALLASAPVASGLPARLPPGVPFGDPPSLIVMDCFFFFFLPPSVISLSLPEMALRRFEASFGFVESIVRRARV